MQAAQENQARKAAKADNKNGDPLVLKSKILAAISDPASPSTSIFIAESAGFVRRVSLDVMTTYRGPNAPVTCVAVSSDGKTLYAGSWDKDIWTWDVATATAGPKLSGHDDFVKTVVCARLGGKDVLLSGGADKKIIVWNAQTGRRLHTLQDPTTSMMAVQHLAVDPVLSTESELVFASAGSDKHIRRWRVTSAGGYEQLPEAFSDRPETERLTIEEHETSVYKLLYDVSSAEDGEDGVDLWTASADGTAKCLSRSRGFVADDVYEHGDYVRGVIVTDNWVVTAGRSEDVKVWDRSSGKLYCTLEGHFEEVTDLVLLPAGAHSPMRVCSVAIDGTIRTWPLARKDLDRVVEDMRVAATKPKDEGAAAGEGLLTAEEEAELAELMDD
ncbi:WD40 repeat [Geosmithia morbida]|uniref:WD40 repeat n=1 Tax=Geosmithia morbida TaxID=1094350 RepID=A0A9P4Z1U9_9HYPO|nr:WD40 repeat [Geosmithia morbida]KAF4125889.1 WD40 repeat [Geosmithia morbida]